MVAVVQENIRIARLFGSLVKVRARLSITSRATESLTKVADLTSEWCLSEKEFHEFFAVPLVLASVKYAPSSTTSSHCFISSTDLFDI